MSTINKNQLLSTSVFGQFGNYDLLDAYGNVVTPAKATFNGTTIFKDVEIEAMNITGDMNVIGIFTNEDSAVFRGDVNMFGNLVSNGPIDLFVSLAMQIGSNLNARGLDISDTVVSYLYGITSSVQSQLNAKAPINSPVFTGIVSGVSKDMIGLSNVENATASTLYAPILSPTFTGNNTYTGNNTFNVKLPTSTLTPTNPTDIITKTYCDTKTTLATVQSSSYAWSGSHHYDTILPMSILTPVNAYDLSTKAYCDTKTTLSVVQSSSYAWSGSHHFDTVLPMSILTPINAYDLITKSYCDTKTTMSAVLANANNWGSTNAFNVSLPTTSLSPTSDTQLVNRKYITDNYVSGLYAASTYVLNSSVAGVVFSYLTTITSNVQDQFNLVRSGTRVLSTLMKSGVISARSTNTASTYTYTTGFPSGAYIMTTTANATFAGNGTNFYIVNILSSTASGFTYNVLNNNADHAETATGISFISICGDGGSYSF